MVTSVAETGCNWDVTAWRRWARRFTCRHPSAETTCHCCRSSQQV